MFFSTDVVCFQLVYCCLQIVLFRRCYGPWSFSNPLFLGTHSFSIRFEIMNLLFEFFFIKTHKTSWPLGRGGNFFPLRSRGFGCSVTTEWSWIAFKFVYVAPFLSVLQDFAWNWALPIAKKLEYDSSHQWFLQKHCTKMYGNSRILLTLNYSCLQCTVGFSDRPNQKVNNV